ncbi:MAG: hypothetical protein LM523_04205, partial [Candidatus Contendobacter sp.]|nr:hypothetical protein [Candidatus Contendobacter sp.]
AAETYPQWVAAITGKIGATIPGGFRLDSPAVQVFEKKAKPEVAAAPITESKAPEPKAPEPVTEIGRPRLSLKGRQS